MTAQDILNIARAQIGTAEQPKGSNNVRYNTDYYGREVSGASYPWCCVFVWWVFNAADAAGLFYGGKKTASCTTLMKYYQGINRIVSYPAPGDLLFYQFDGDSYADHIGIVESVDGGKIITIEGNTGDMVKRVTVDNAKIMCLARPEYDYAGTDNPSVSCADSSLYTREPTGDAVAVNLPLLRSGCTGKSVLSLQYLLIAYGFKLPKYGADADFGAETETAVKAYQDAQHITADGICGAETWTMLLR